jgi:cell division protein FtsB
LFLLVAVVVVGNALVGERGLVAMLRASYDLSELSASIGALRRENSALREEVRALSDEPRRIEALARRELGLIRPGERLFIVSAVPSDDVAIPESLRP